MLARPVTPHRKRLFWGASSVMNKGRKPEGTALLHADRLRPQDEKGVEKDTWTGFPLPRGDLSVFLLLEPGYLLPVGADLFPLSEPG